MLFGILLPNLFFGQGTWIPFSSPAPKNINFNLIRSDNLSISFAVDVPGMLEEDTVVGGLLYKKLQIPGMADFEMDEGFPQIPFICKMIAIPEYDSLSINYNTIDSYIYNDILLFPRPTNQVIEDTNGLYHFEDIFTKNDSIYSLNCNMLALDYKIKSTGYFRSQKYLELIIYPIKYNPADQKLTVNFIFEITSVAS